MRKKLKNWKATHHPPTLFNMVVAPDRHEAVIVSRHMAPRRENSPSPPRRRLRRLPGLFKDAWRDFLAWDRELQPTPAIPPIHWLKRAVMAVLAWFRAFWRPKPEPKRVMCPSKPWKFRPSRWQESRPCPVCKNWAIFPEYAGWCYECSRPMAAYLKNWKAVNA